MSDIIRQGWLQKLFFYLTNKSLVKKPAYSASAKESVKKHTTCEAKPTVSNQKKSWLNVDIPFWLPWCMGVQSDRYIFLVRKILNLYFFLDTTKIAATYKYFYYKIFSKYHFDIRHERHYWLYCQVSIRYTTSTTMSVSLTCTVD